jgi:prepilin-type N-terminal cleavage/methylation domain-containing protein
MRDTRYENGFTLAELLIALIVTSIVLTSVATLAYALGKANDTTQDMSQKQARVRCATLRISELIRHCKLICSTVDNDMVVWKVDDNPENDRIDVLELAYIETGSNRDYIKILEFSTCPDWLKLWFRNRSWQINTIQQNWFKNLLIWQCGESRTELIQQCSNVQFLLDTDAPQTRSVSISFDLEENGVMQNYQISTSLRGWAGNLLNDSGEIVDGDDD